MHLTLIHFTISFAVASLIISLVAMLLGWVQLRRARKQLVFSTLFLLLVCPILAGIYASFPVSESLEELNATPSSVSIVNISATRPTVTVSGVAVLVWIAGFVFSLALILRDIVASCRHRVTLQVCENEAVLTRFAIHRAAASREMSLYTDPDASVPYCLGIINTAIVIPESAIAQFDEEELDMVIAHEITHIRNRDNLILVLQRVAEAIHWWNPVVKKLSGCLYISRELLADREACIYGNPKSYSKILLEFNSGRLCTIPPLTSSMASPSKSFLTIKRRIETILDSESDPNKLNSVNIIGPIALVIAALIPLTVGVVAADKHRHHHSGDGGRHDGELCSKKGAIRSKARSGK